MVLVIAAAFSRAAATAARTVSTSHDQLPFLPAFALNFGRPSVRRRSCSYSSGACSNRSRHAESAVRPSASLSSGSVHEPASSQTASRSEWSPREFEGWGVGLGSHPFLHEVPVGVAGERDRAECDEAGVGVQREQQRALERGIVEQEIDEACPTILERHL